MKKPDRDRVQVDASKIWKRKRDKRKCPNLPKGERCPLCGSSWTCGQSWRERETQPGGTQ